MSIAMADMQDPIMQEQTMDRTLEVKPLPVAAAIGSILVLPIQLLIGWLVVDPKQVVVTTHCGVLTKVYDEPGCFPVPICGQEKRVVSTAMQSMDLPNSKIVDGNGNPILVSAIVNFVVVNPRQAIYGTTNYMSYLSINASATLKAVVGNHTYNELKSNTLVINKELADALQPQVDVAGLRILSVSLNELNYAPEIAANMLKKQAAGAMIEARQLIVEGAVQIAQDAVARLERGNLVLSDQDKVKIVTNLLTVTCGESGAQPAVIV